MLLDQLYNDESRYAYKFHHLLFHSNLLEKLIDATYSLAQEDPLMKDAIIALFSGTQTRKQIWEQMMKRKWKLVKKLGLKSSLRLIPTLIKASRI